MRDRKRILKKNYGYSKKNYTYSKYNKKYKNNANKRISNNLNSDLPSENNSSEGINFFGVILGIFVCFLLITKLDYLYRFDYNDGNYIAGFISGMLIGSISSNLIIVKLSAFVLDLWLIRLLFFGKGSDVRRVIKYIILLTAFVYFIEPFIFPDVGEYLLGELLSAFTFLKAIPVFISSLFYYIVIYIFSFWLRR